MAWHDYAFKTKLEVTEDSRDPKRLTTAFKLLQSVRLLRQGCIAECPCFCETSPKSSQRDEVP